MTLKTSFAQVLRSIRAKRNISQRDFIDTSRTFLSKLESAKSSPTLDKLEQISQRLELSPLTLLTLSLSLERGKPAAELIEHLRGEIETLARDGVVPGLQPATCEMTTRASQSRQRCQAALNGQTEFAFLDAQDSQLHQPSRLETAGNKTALGHTTLDPIMLGA
ncbi:helix-turn-helix transcriptional regulator [Pseudomonas putida]|uniref:helix-turn-helix domain-containing protein n=1 Tax=Pseudomonas putida TaxID=303 RepID=UPI0018A90296|nr:helix-turn-helix transcriptional regulator [Pseudomonas putida]MBF8766180.1 helix-turn-helix transcriptional regulator [Pseudomonas putida]